MKNSNKDGDLKEKLKQALGSTIRVISEDFVINNKKTEIRNNKKFDSSRNVKRRWNEICKSLS